MSTQLFVFQSTYLTYKAERTLKNAGVACKLVTKPRHISSDCGLAVQVDLEEGPRSAVLLQEAGVEVLLVCAS